MVMIVGLTIVTKAQICPGDSYTLTAPAGYESYDWYIGSVTGTPISSGQTFAVAPTTTTTYTCNMFDPFAFIYVTLDFPVVVLLSTDPSCNTNSGGGNTGSGCTYSCKPGYFSLCWKRNTLCLPSVAAAKFLKAGAVCGPCAGQTSDGYHDESSDDDHEGTNGGDDEGDDDGGHSKGGKGGKGKHDRITSHVSYSVHIQNPITNSIKLNVISNSNEYVTLSIIDITGKVVYQSNRIQANEISNLELDINPGVYFLSTVQGANRSFNRILKVN